MSHEPQRGIGARPHSWRGELLSWKTAAATGLNAGLRVLDDGRFGGRHAELTGGYAGALAAGVAGGLIGAALRRGRHPS